MERELGVGILPGGFWGLGFRNFPPTGWRLFGAFGVAGRYLIVNGGDYGRSGGCGKVCGWLFSEYFCGVGIPGCNARPGQPKCPVVPGRLKRRIVQNITIIVCHPIRGQPLNSPLSRISADALFAERLKDDLEIRNLYIG